MNCMVAMMPINGNTVTPKGRTRRRSYSGFALVLTLLAACGGGSSGDIAGSWRAEREQLGDTSVVRTVGGSVWGDTMTLVPELAIGQLEGEEAYLFGNVRGVDVLDDGRIVVVDRQASQIRVFSPEGLHLLTMGREGDGPGELRNPDHVRVTSDGRIIVRGRLGRFSVFSVDGSYLGSWQVRSGFSTAAPFFLDDAGRVVHPAFSDSLVRYEVDGTELEIVPNPTRGYSPPQLEVTTQGGRAIYPAPFVPSEAWTMTVDGTFVFGFGGEYSFERWDPDGRVLRVQRTVAAVPVLPAEGSQARDIVTRTIRRINDPTWRWQGPDIPTHKPFFYSILPGRDGSFWLLRQGVGVERPNPAWDPDNPGDDFPTTWVAPVVADVFDRDGRFLGPVTLPPDMRYLPLPVVSTDRVWAVVPHETGYPQVVRFRIEPLER